MRYSNLKFFDKSGIPLNFEYSSTEEKWTGRIHMPRISVGLFEVAHLYIIEEFLNVTNETIHAKPHIDDSTGPNSDILVEWKELDEKSFFLFNFDINNEKPIIEKFDFLEVPFDVDTSEYYLSGSTVKTTTLLTNEIIQLNIAFNATDDDAYERTLILTDKNDGLPILELVLYCEAVGEDERLKVLTENLGYKVLPEDNPIFRKTNVKEASTDFITINNKRKEILMEGHNIRPFIGSYKGLINAIKFYGYSDLVI